MSLFIGILLFNIVLGFLLKPNNHKKNKITYIMFMTLILIFVSGLRARNVGMDTEQYWRQYSIVGNLGWGDVALSRYEIGYFLLNKICYVIKSEPQFLFFIVSISIFSCFSYFIYKNSYDVVLSYFLLISFNYYFFYFNAIRQGLAMGIILVAYEFLKTRKYVKYLVMVLLASYFHSSALIMLCLIIFSYRKYSIKILSLSIIFSLILFAFSDKIIPYFFKFGSYDVYLTSKYNFSNYFGSLMESLKIFVLLILGVYEIYRYKSDAYFIGKINNSIKSKFIVKIKKNKARNTKLLEFNHAHLYSYILSIAFLLSVLTIKMNILNRVTAYFEFFIIVWIPLFLKGIKNKNKQIIIKWAIIIIALAYFIIIAIFRPEWNGVIPYSIN